jgi:CRP/FNR family transcriptional regulator, nitrogen oxide reductase regulator
MKVGPTAPLIQILAKTSLFKDLIPSDLEQVIKSARIHDIGVDEFYFFEGDPAEKVYVLKTGKVRLTQVTVEGQQVILRYIQPGDEFGIIAALSEINYPVTAEAVAACSSLTWDKATMQTLMHRFPKIAINGLHILANRVQEFQDRLREMATERVERRIARALLRLVRQAGRKIDEGVLIDLPLSRQDLAEMTGTTLYTVSRILSQWENQTIIQSGRERIVIRYPHGLVIIAEDLPPGKGPYSDE